MALVGESSDGHQYIDLAAEKGATAIIHRKGKSCPQGVISFAVDDTLVAWRRIAKAWRNEFKIPVIAIGGSAGKTTSKELLAAILSGKFNVLKTEASQNGFQGIPTTLLRLRSEHEIAVIEVGIDEPHAMSQHLEIVAPVAGLLSSIGEEHLEKLIDLDTVEREEGILFQVLESRNGFAAVNADDERILRQSRVLKNATSKTYGLDSSAKIRGFYSPGENNLSVDGISTNSESFPLPLDGAHNARNLLGAICLAHHFGLTVVEMKNGLAKFRAPAGRSEWHQWQGRKVFVDTYNANPASVVAALDVVFAKSNQTWVCLADMLELGTLEEKLHRGLADSILKHAAPHVFLYGPRMKWLWEELKKRGYQNAKHFSAQNEMSDAIMAECKPGEQILLKGSRGLKMEKVWEMLQTKK